jgi:hypothetical protein
MKKDNFRLQKTLPQRYSAFPCIRIWKKKIRRKSSDTLPRDIMHPATESTSRKAEQIPRNGYCALCKATVLWLIQRKRTKKSP